MFIYAIKYSFKATHLFTGHYEVDRIDNLFSSRFTNFRN
jgi:hypothetical protein